MNIAKFAVAFSPVLSPIQKIGYENYPLPLRQVMKKKFGNHTLKAIDLLAKKNITTFPEICELTKAQAIGISELDLTIPQVYSPNFDEHTVEGMIELKKLNPSSTHQSNFATIAGLNETETIEAISSYKIRFLKQAINKKIDKKKSLKSLNKKKTSKKHRKGKKQ